MDLGMYLVLSTVTFGLGAGGFIARKNILVQLMCIELMLNAVNVMLVAFNRFHPSDHSGQGFAFFVIAVAAAEAAVGLAILINLYRIKQTVESDVVNELRN